MATAEAKLTRPKHHWVDDYTILSVTPTDNFAAVYKEPVGDNPDRFTLHAYPLDGIGVATLVQKKIVDGTVVREREPSNEVVGLDLSEGWWHIAEDASNFVGVCRKDEDFEKVFKHEKTTHVKTEVASTQTRPGAGEKFLSAAP